MRWWGHEVGPHTLEERPQGEDTATRHHLWARKQDLTRHRICQRLDLGLQSVVSASCLWCPVIAASMAKKACYLTFSSSEIWGGSNSKHPLLHTHHVHTQLQGSLVSMHRRSAINNSSSFFVMECVIIIPPVFSWIPEVHQSPCAVGLRRPQLLGHCGQFRTPGE